MLAKGALKSSKDMSLCFCSCLSLVEETIGSLRPVSDLLLTSTFVQQMEFKITAACSVLSFILKRKFMASVDLKNVHFSDSHLSCIN